ncbi:MAG TPA: FMN-binding protein [Burkholderiales bacterium]|nr:FMN-binding protein [Burkholderiales bacterium]
MTLDIRWLVPAAIYAAAPQCIAAKYMSVEQARALIFPFADEFVVKTVQLTPEQMQEVDKSSGVPGRMAQQQAWQALAKGKMIGWFFVDQVIGKHELITYALGINADGSVQQVQIIEYQEAYGYQVRELKWRDQFPGKTVGSPLQVGTDIGNISGATLSVRHLTDGIRRLLFLHQSVLR